MILAMWSGPRNLSTAMMRSFSQRSDCEVWDEPFYAAYLAKTGSSHPLAQEIIETYETNPDIVARHCLQPGCKPVFYQKHMTHHMIDGFPRDWIAQTRNVFLIRDPRDVVASYHKKRENPALEELGFAQQSQLLSMLGERTGEIPLIVDAMDIRRAPEAMLKTLCLALGLPFEPAMLSWPPGPHPKDGLWGEHWYPAIWSSTGFEAPAETSSGPLPAPLEDIVAAAAEGYAEMFEKRLRPAKH